MKYIPSHWCWTRRRSYRSFRSRITQTWPSNYKISRQRSGFSFTCSCTSQGIRVDPFICLIIPGWSYEIDISFIHLHKSNSVYISVNSNCSSWISCIKSKRYLKNNVCYWLLVEKHYSINKHFCGRVTNS